MYFSKKDNMGIFTGWVLQIVGVVILSVLVDIIIPEGQTSKYIKSIFSVVVILVIVSPIPKLISMEFSVEEVFKDEQVEYVDEQFLEFYKEIQTTQIINNITAMLENSDYKVKSINVETNPNKTDLELQKILIILNKKGINWENGHINITEKVRQIVLSIVNINEESVVVYAE